MIGIYSVLGLEFKLKQLLNNYCSNKTSFDFVKTDFGSFGIIYSNFNEPFAIAKENEDWIFIDGFIFDEFGKQILAKDILEKIKINKKFLQNLNGEFFIVAQVDNKPFFINDIMGQRQHSIASNNIGIYAISPSPGLSLKFLGEERKINSKSLFTFITTKKLRYQRDTIWEKCKVLEPGCIFSFNKGKIERNKYWDIVYSKNIEKFETQEFIDIYKKAVNTRMLTNNVGITLTGGLDSRSLIAAINKDKLSKLKAYTMGAEGCEEVLVASQVAKELNVSHFPFEVTPEKVLDKKAQDYFLDEDVDLIIQGLWNPFTQEINDSDYLLHGLDLDVTLGGIYLTDELLKVENIEDYHKFVIKDNLRISQEQILKLFKKEKLDELNFDIQEYIKKIADQSAGNDFIEKYDRFILKHSMNRVILQRYRGIRKHIETLSPMYDRKVLDYIFSLNIKARTNYKAFYPFINKLSNNLAKINYQRTNLPANIPVKFWKESQIIEKDREELCREIARDSRGKDFVPYTRYYTNVDEWMRFNSKWMLAIKDLLQSDKSILRRDWLNQDYIDKLISEHQNHEKSNLGVIHTLMSAEIFLRLEKNVSFNT